MTIWSPLLEPSGPLYRSLALAIERDVARGALAPGARLPTQRALASRLGIGIATVTRAYAEAERLGLISSEVGRGTFVKAPAAGGAAGGVADLRGNSLLPWPLLDDLQRRLARGLERADARAAFDYAPHGGSLRHRAAGLRAAAEAGVPAQADQLLVTAGAQHAMTVVFSTLLRPGDALLVEELTYTGMRSLAQLLGLQLRPVATDDQGLRPDSLRAACADDRARALYCMPVLQNPTAAVMSAGRRDEIAEIARRAGVQVVEDDTYGFLLPDAPRLASVLPDAVWITGTSKSLLPALRVGFLRAPAELVPHLEAAIGATIYLVSPLLAGLVADWIEDGTAARVAQWKREEIEARQHEAARALAGFAVRSHPRSPHLWLELPPRWTARALAAASAERGVLVTPGEAFAAGAGTPGAARVCLGPPATRSALAEALARLTEVLRGSPPPAGVVA
jgi:DNA-binding transcriptional MocR family regulator